MKETVNVNIGSEAFILDEDAYSALRSYLDDIRSRLPEEDAETMDDIEARMAELFRERVVSSMRVVTLAIVRGAMARMGAPSVFGEQRRTGRSAANACGANASSQSGSDELVATPNSEPCSRPDGTSVANLGGNSGSSSDAYPDAPSGTGGCGKHSGANASAQSDANASGPIRRLSRSRGDRLLAGVCGGFGEYIGVDPTLIRLATLLLVLFGGISVWIYIILWIVVPEAPVRKFDTNHRLKR